MQDSQFRPQFFQSNKPYDKQIHYEQKQEADFKCSQQTNYEKKEPFQKIKTNKDCLEVLQSLLEVMKKYKQSIEVTMDRIISGIQQQISRIIEQLAPQMIQKKDNEQIKEEFTLISQYLQNLDLASNNIFNQLQLLEKKYRSFNLKSFQYKLLEGQNIKQNQNCQAFAFSDENIFYGSGQLIKINQFKNGCLGKEVQSLPGHNSDISCLQFLKYSNEIISASSDSLIIVWNKNHYDSFIVKQKLADHTSQINCLVVNFQETLFISGSNDQTLKFWSKEKEIWQLYSTLLTPFLVFGLSLDSELNRLIACGSAQTILIIELNVHYQWHIKQTINTQQYGYRICFINQNTFTFQPNKQEYLEIYQFDYKLKEFKKDHAVEVKSSEADSVFFPGQFIKSKQILIVKNNNYLNILGIRKNGQLHFQQTIQFDTYRQFGRVTEDGEYLVTWDSFTKEIQVRKLEIDQG